MSLQNKYIEFNNIIAVTRESSKYKAAREKDDVIREKIKQAFRDEGYDVLPDFIQGSMKTHTAIEPLDGDYDIDRAMAITYDSAPKNPIEPKKIIKMVLSTHGFSDPRIKKPCVTADYKADPMHIDIPTYRVDASDRYELAIGKENSNEENRSWDESDPKGLTEWITSSVNHQESWSSLTSSEKQQFYRLVRYLKRWRDFKYQSEKSRKKIYSIALTIMMKESFKPCKTEDGKDDDNNALKRAIDVILDQKGYFTSIGDGEYNMVVNLPVTPYNDIFDDKGEQVATTLRNRLDRLRNALAEVNDLDSEKKQCNKLREQFGDDFPEGKDKSRKIQKSAGFVGVSSGA